MKKPNHQASRPARVGIRGVTYCVTLLTALFCAAQARALTASEWKNRQSLTIESAGVIKLSLPVDTLGAARPGLEDLRLVDPIGQEVPYVIAMPPARPRTVISAKSFRDSLTDSQTQLLIETGTNEALEAVTLTTPAVGFIKAVRIETSVNGTTWTEMTSGVPIFRQFGTEQLRLPLPERRTAWLRITIDDRRTPPIPFTAASLTLAPALVTPAPAEPLPVRNTQRDEFAGETVFTLDLGASNLTLAAIEFVTSEPLFARNVSLSVRELHDGTPIERTVARGTIYRVAAEGLSPTARLDIPLDVRLPSRELFVHIENQDSPPIAVGEVVVRRRPIWIVFRASQAGAYSVLTGHGQISTPRYDLAALSSHLKDIAPGSSAFGPVAANPDYQRPETLAETPLRGAALDPAPWRFRKPVQLSTSGVQQLELELDVLAHAQPGLGDLRLVRDGAQVPYLLERPGLSRSVALNFKSVDDPQRPSVSRWEIKLPRAGLPLETIKLSSPTPLFQRNLRLTEKVTDSHGHSRIATLGVMDWNQTPGSDRRQIAIRLAMHPQTDTLLLETDNGDNPPIALTGISATHPVVRVLFKAEAGPLALYYGNREVTAPRYDVALVAGQIIAAEKFVATLGPEEGGVEPGWARKTLAGLRGGPIFWGALAVVVIVLLIAVAKLLPKPPASTA